MIHLQSTCMHKTLEIFSVYKQAMFNSSLFSIKSIYHGKGREEENTVILYTNI